MADPTEYDLVQDQQISELQDVVTVSDNPIEGPEHSFPIPDYPVNQEQFQLLSLTNGNGIIDRGDYPYWLEGWGSDSETNQKNSMILKVGQSSGKAEAVVAGYYHVLTEDKEIPLPAVTSTTTYRIALTYDQREDEDRLGPVSVQVYTTEPPTTFARIHSVQYTVTRRPNELLTNATVERFRPRTVAPIAVLKREHLPDPRNVLFGSIAIVYGENDIVIARGASTSEGGPTRWESLLSPEWTNPGDTDSYVWPGHGYRRGYRIVGDTLEFRGRIGRTGNLKFAVGGGDNEAGYHLYNFGADKAPKQSMRFLTASDGYSGNKICVITVTVDGNVYGTPILGNATWMSIDGIRVPMKE